MNIGDRVKVTRVFDCGDDKWMLGLEGIIIAKDHDDMPFLVKFNNGLMNGVFEQEIVRA